MGDPGSTCAYWLGASLGDCHGVRGYVEDLPGNSRLRSVESALPDSLEPL